MVLRQKGGRAAFGVARAAAPRPHYILLLGALRKERDAGPFIRQQSVVRKAHEAEPAESRQDRQDIEKGRLNGREIYRMV